MLSEPPQVCQSRLDRSWSRPRPRFPEIGAYESHCEPTLQDSRCLTCFLDGFLKENRKAMGFWPSIWGSVKPGDRWNMASGFSRPVWWHRVNPVTLPGHGVCRRKVLCCAAVSIQVGWWCCRGLTCKHVCVYIYIKLYIYILYRHSNVLPIYDFDIMNAIFRIYDYIHTYILIYIYNIMKLYYRFHRLLFIL